MQKKVEPKRRHVPRRVCVACREVTGKRGLIRIVRTDNGVRIDPTGKMSGRGAYLHSNPVCWQIALETNRLSQSLRTKISAETRQELESFFETLPEPTA